MSFWGLIYIFNRVSKSRIKLVGPNRACAEWLMRNGAFVKWVNSGHFITDYNHLPLDPKEPGQYLIKEIDAVDAGLAYYGFPHFEGCEHIDRIRFENCDHICNKAMDLLQYLKNSLQHLEIIQCKQVTDAGLISLKQLPKLKTLKVAKLKRVTNLAGTINELKKSLPNCEIISSDKTISATINSEVK